MEEPKMVKAKMTIVKVDYEGNEMEFCSNIEPNKVKLEDIKDWFIGFDYKYPIDISKLKLVSVREGDVEIPER